MKLIKNSLPIRLPGWIGLCFALLLLGGWGSLLAFGQGNAYIEDNVNAGQKKMEAKIGEMLRNTTPLDKEVFDTYYNSYALARWTNIKNFGAALTGFRKDLKNNLIQSKSGPTHDHLNEVVLKFMKERADQNYHPSVRYNAMYMIGELNETDSAGSAQSKPWQDALPVLLAAVNDPKQIEPVKVAALVGINRHLATGTVKPDMQAQILPLMLKLAAPAGDDAPKDEGRDWLRMQAIEILGLLHKVGQNNQVVDLLLKTISDEKTRPMTRCAAASALKDLDYPSAAGLKSEPIVKTLGEFLYFSTQDGKNATNKDLLVRCMLTRINAVQEGLSGANKLAKSQPEKEYLEKLQKIADGLAKNLGKSTITLDAAKKNLEDSGAELEKFLQK
jgi:hypothetical protein